MVRTVLTLVIGAVVTVGLMVAAVLLWTRNLIVFGAPLGVAALAAAWVTVDNVFIYHPKPRPEEPPPVQQEQLPPPQ